MGFDHARRSVMWPIVLIDGANNAHARGLSHIRRDATEDVDDTGFPFRQLIARRRQRAERGPIELLEQRPSADAEDLHRAAIDDVDALANRGIERREIEKGPMP